MKDDIISRQAAIDEWKNDFKGYINALNIPKDDYKGIMEYIDELPSAQPDIPDINVIIDTIKNAINASTGNEAYMVGLRNGMRWCWSALTDKELEYEDMAPAEQWISCTPETMPEKDGRYVCTYTYNDKKDVFIFRYEDGDFIVPWYVDAVTAWYKPLDPWEGE